jgi:hypothetical protein
MAPVQAMHMDNITEIPAAFSLSHNIQIIDNPMIVDQPPESDPMIEQLILDKIDIIMADLQNISLNKDIPEELQSSDTSSKDILWDTSSTHSFLPNPVSLIKDAKEVG